MKDASPQAIPPDPPASFEWNATNSGSNWWQATALAQVEAAFNAARSRENGDSVAASYEPMPLMNLTGSFSQPAWDALSPSDQALWLLNSERAARGLPQFEGVNADLTGVIQSYVQLLLDTDQSGHSANGTTFDSRVNANPALSGCWTWLAENLAYQYATSDSFRFSVPVPKAIYDWIYKDSGSAWGHRHNVLQDPFSDDTGVVGQEALIGFGVAQGEDWIYGGVNRKYAYIEGLHVYDPRSTCGSLAPASGSAIHADYGDLPASYGAAWHTVGGPSLGTTKSLETTMTGADTTDDGVALIGDFAAGQPVTLRINVQDQTPETGRWLRAWFDWNNDGVFDATEIAHDGIAANGDNDLVFDVPATAASAVNHRVRLYDSASAPAAPEMRAASATVAPGASVDPGAHGGARGGEVEDGITTQVACVPGTIDLDITIVSGKVRLTWTPAAGVAGYQVHRSDRPYFTPTVSYAAGATSPWPDQNTNVGNPAVNYTYLLRAPGCVEPSSVRVAEFDFALTPGQ